MRNFLKNNLNLTDNVIRYEALPAWRRFLYAWNFCIKTIGFRGLLYPITYYKIYKLTKRK